MQFITIQKNPNEFDPLHEENLANAIRLYSRFPQSTYDVFQQRIPPVIVVGKNSNALSKLLSKYKNFNDVAAEYDLQSYK